MSSDAEEEEEVERGRCSPKAHFPSRDSLMFVRWYVVINRFLECVWREGVLHLTAGSELLLGRWIETNRWISQRDFYQLQPEKVLVYITTTRLFSPFWSIITPVVFFFFHFQHYHDIFFFWHPTSSVPNMGSVGQNWSTGGFISARLIDFESKNVRSMFTMFCKNIFK